MPRKTMIEAIRDGLDVMMGRDERVVVMARMSAISAACSAAPPASQVWQDAMLRCTDQ
jgi:hypothetical protein